jgi:hypothetical protein
MKLSKLLVVNAIVSGVFGIALVLIPWEVFKFYGIQADPAINYVGQLYGAALLGFAVLSWSARNAGPSESRKAIVLAFFIGDSIGFVVALIARFGGVVNALGWSSVALYLLLALSFGYFQFTKSSS